jgi:hypothetical protein
MSTTAFLTSVETETAPFLIFPNITICHPLYFDKYKMEVNFEKKKQKKKKRFLQIRFSLSLFEF